MSSEAPELIEVENRRGGREHIVRKALSIPTTTSMPEEWFRTRYRRADLAEREIAERDAEIARLRNALKLLGEGSTDWMVVKGRLEVWELMAQYAREVLEGNK